MNLDKNEYSIGYLDEKDDYILFLSNNNTLEGNIDNEQKYPSVLS